MMIPAILLKGTEPVIGTRSVAAGRTDALRLLPQLDPGEILSARVDAKLPDGSYKVLVAGQELRMSLPTFVAPGDTLELAFVTREPSPTFQLRSVLPQGAAEAPSLSTAGRLVAAAMLQAGAAPMPTTAAVPGPLLSAAPADGARLSGQLAQTLSTSGLFYESHQAQWVAGTRDLPQLMQEPQARLLRSAPSDTQASTQAIAPQALPLVQMQLATLDTSVVMMQLEIWPRQWMQWTVEEQPTDANAQDEGAPQPDWNTRLRLVLPRLGELNAMLSFGAGGVMIRVEADKAASAELLQTNGASLQEALSAAGLPSARISITRHAQT
jgi:hypothetical protein